ncbi:MAG: hypothetical protein HYR85_18785 [Planctomycetes bacterium]|nr:hypothetical protein [Planctomycetota bacterium]MBI3847366.1 hypothetical protein [Planctomycetota bacterium]
MESVEELREICQRPVETLNDLPGRLYGNRISIYVTRSFLQLGISANAASALMAIFGLAGAGLLVFGRVVAIAGFALLEISYILDCVDGEIARYQRRTSLLAAAYDYVTHLLIKSAAYICLGIGLFGELHEPWVLIAAFVALLATLLQKFLWDLASILFCRKLLLLPDREEAMRFIEELMPEGVPEAPRIVRRAGLRRVLGAARSLFLNFDVAVILLLFASVADAFGARWTVGHIVLNAKATLLLALAIALPVHFVDSLITYVRKGHLHRDLRRLTVRSREIASREVRPARGREASAAPIA